MSSLPPPSAGSERPPGRATGARRRRFDPTVAVGLVVVFVLLGLFAWLLASDWAGGDEDGRATGAPTAGGAPTTTAAAPTTTVRATTTTSPPPTTVDVSFAELARWKDENRQAVSRIADSLSRFREAVERWDIVDAGNTARVVAADFRNLADTVPIGSEEGERIRRAAGTCADTYDRIVQAVKDFQLDELRSAAQTSAACAAEFREVLQW